jgi:protein-tyrosine-phosphatase
LTRHLVNRAGLEISVDSAGVDSNKIREVLYARNDIAANPQIRTILREQYGVPEIDDHICKEITSRIMDNSSLVLAADKKVLEKLRKKFPEYADRIRTVYGFISGNEQEGDMTDPYAIKTTEAYQASAMESRELSGRVLNRVLETA